MPLTELWKSAQKEIQDKHVQQMIGFAGDGKLRDGGTASKEFRDFLALISPDFLSRYANDCINEGFDSSGLALQDIINEVGTRLGFRVEQGRYRGTQNQIGYDGLWISPDGHALVVEVKTTDAYRIDLERIATYRRDLITNKKVDEANCSILIIVGREDTGGMEAQVRGSRHAWDVRLISIDALLRLMHLKVDLEDPKIIDKIRRVLIPQEFTKLDGIIDLVFSTAEDVKKEDELTEIDDEDEDETQGPKFVPSNFRDECASRIQKYLKKPLVKRSFAVYSSPDEKLAAICINSREYKKTKIAGYWFGFHPHQRDLIQAYKEAYVALGCGSPETILLIPGKVFISWLDRFNKTERPERFYWHVRVRNDNGAYTLQVKRGANPVKLNEYLIK